MIKKEELRVGNIVSIGTVSGLRNNTVVISDFSGCLREEAYSFLRPFVITKDIIRRNFEQDKRVVFCYDRNGCSFSIKGLSGSIRLNYVHELQNFYFELTGKEL